jgi:hypothetical protein
MKSTPTFKRSLGSVCSFLRRRIDNFLTGWIITVGRWKGHDEQVIVKNALGSKEDIQALARTVMFVNAFDRMGKLFNLQPDSETNYNMALLGWAAILQHYPDSEPAKRWMVLFDTAQTFEDLWLFFLKENKIDPRRVEFLTGYDPQFFCWLLQQQITPNHGFGINLEVSCAYGSVPDQTRNEFALFLRSKSPI